MSTRFTPLETAVLDALSWELRDAAPDLAGQVAESLPGQRRNTGSGLFTEMIVDRSRPPPMTTPTGRFGTVHAMVGDLADPLAFQVELRGGRLLYLFGDAYGQDTRAIDFARVAFDQVFTIDAQGESIAFDPAALMPPSPLLELHHHVDQAPPPSLASQLFDIGTLQRPQDSAPRSVIDAITSSGEANAPPPDKADQTSLLIGLWVVIAGLAVLAIVIFDVSLLFAILAAVVLGRTLQKPAILSMLARWAHRFGQYEYRPPER